MEATVSSLPPFWRVQRWSGPRMPQGPCKEGRWGLTEGGTEARQVIGARCLQSQNMGARDVLEGGWLGPHLFPESPCGPRRRGAKTFEA